MNSVVQYFFKEETLNVMYFLNSLRLFGKNSIPEKKIQLTDLLNLVFMTGLISFAMKTAKVVPTYRDYPPISVLSNSVTILEKRMYKSFYTFLNNNNIIYNTQCGVGKQYSISNK